MRVFNKWTGRPVKRPCKISHLVDDTGLLNTSLVILVLVLKWFSGNSTILLLAPGVDRKRIAVMCGRVMLLMLDAYVYNIYSNWTTGLNNRKPIPIFSENSLMDSRHSQPAHLVIHFTACQCISDKYLFIRMPLAGLTYWRVALLPDGWRLSLPITKWLVVGNQVYTGRLPSSQNCGMSRGTYGSSVMDFYMPVKTRRYCITWQQSMQKFGFSSDKVQRNYQDGHTIYSKATWIHSLVHQYVIGRSG